MLQRRCTAAAAAPAARLPQTMLLARSGVAATRQRRCTAAAAAAPAPAARLPRSGTSTAWTRHVRTQSSAAASFPGGDGAADNKQPARKQEDAAAAPAAEAAAAAQTPQTDQTQQPPQQQQQQQPQTVWQRIKKFFVGEKLDAKRMRELGMGCVLSYGIISNINYGSALSIAWLGYVKINGVAPTDPGQWAPFLAYYAGIWAIQNFLRPLRISVAIGLAPVCDRAMAAVSQRLGIAKGWAFGLLTFAMGLVTTTILFSVLFLLGGFPSGLPFLQKTTIA